MTIEIRGIDTDRALRARVTRRLGALVKRLPEPARAQVTFFDDDGPKGGPAVRCALTVHQPGRRVLRLEEVALRATTAFDLALAALGRRLTEDRERLRAARRHPKKYYTARVLREGSGPGTG